MTWFWRYEKGDGTVIPPKDMPRDTFTTQSDAETWLGETWRTLLEAGVDQVTLFGDNEVVYGPMSLHPPE